MKNETNTGNGWITRKTIAGVMSPEAAAQVIKNHYKHAAIVSIATKYPHVPTRAGAAQTYLVTIL